MVEIRYQGQLGNRLFQYCFGRILAESLGYRLVAEPIPGFPGTRQSVEGQDHSAERVQVLTGHRVDVASLLRDRTPRKIVLRGYFQRYEYYRPYKDIIREAWLHMPRPADYSSPLPGPDDLAMHVRLGEFVRGQGPIPSSYYERILTSLRYEDLFLVTDRPGHPFLRQLESFRPNVISANHLHDFYLLKSAPRMIQGNSTFSWWAGFLSDGEIHAPLYRTGPAVWIGTNWIVDDEPRYHYTPYPEPLSNRLRFHARYVPWKILVGVRVFMAVRREYPSLISSPASSVAFRLLEGLESVLNVFRKRGSRSS